MSQHTDTIGVGVIGMGFMGWRHVEAFAAAERAGFPCRVVAVCDPNAAKRAAPAAAGNIASTERPPSDMARVAGYQRPEHLLVDPSVRLVSVCTPTDSHTTIALQALAAGKHVLVEKPVGLSADAVRPLAEAARAADTLCMPAHCMRFWPGWTWLKETIDSGVLGRLVSASFLRAGTRPAWSPFYADDQRTGGVLTDFHLHDADFILWAMGRPRSVLCEGSASRVRSSYRFGDADAAQVTAEADWTRAPEDGFRMTFTARFERATAEFEMGRDPVLTVTDEGGVRAISIPEGTGYDHQARHLIRAIAEGRTDLRVTMDDALIAAALLDAERRSLESGDWVTP